MDIIYRTALSLGSSLVELYTMFKYSNLHITKVAGSDAEDAHLIPAWKAGKVPSNGQGSASTVLWYGYIFLSFFFFFPI